MQGLRGGGTFRDHALGRRGDRRVSWGYRLPLQLEWRNERWRLAMQSHRGAAISRCWQLDAPYEGSSPPTDQRGRRRGLSPEIGQLYRAMGYHIREHLYRFIRIVDPSRQKRSLSVTVGVLGFARCPWRQMRPISELKSPTSLDQCWDRFWQRFSEQGYFGANRNSSYINWRYLRHPRMQHLRQGCRRSRR